MESGDLGTPVRPVAGAIRHSQLHYPVRTVVGGVPGQDRKYPYAVLAGIPPSIHTEQARSRRDAFLFFMSQ